MHTKTPITLRMDPELLAAARAQASAENRTLTNFVETVLMERLGAAAKQEPRTLTPNDAAPSQDGGRTQ